MKFKIKKGISIGEGYRGETSLRRCLELISLSMGLIKDENTLWSLHHLNGDHFDNRIENLGLMERGKHSSYHRKLNNRKIDENSAEGRKLFDDEYADYYINIGEELKKLIDSSATKESIQDDK